MKSILWPCAAALLSLSALAQDETTPGVSIEETAQTGASERPDYGNSDNWLCHPGNAGDDACSGDLTTTIVRAGDGSVEPLTEVEPFVAATDPAIDCFYVYPTVSTDQSGNSDMIADAAEKRVTYVQFARFGSVCRTFAPMYRQITLKGLFESMSGKQDAFDPAMGYLDVKAAWEHYLEHDNNGRGVVLVGHSQGANMIQLLLANDILGSEAEDLVISAMPIGYTIPVDAETHAFNGMPLCESKTQTGCLISYVSFRKDAPPPASAWFGMTSPDGKPAACVNPGALTGEGALHPYLSNTPDPTGKPPAFAGDTIAVTTPFASLPGLLSAECVSDGTHTYLAVETHADPADPRTDRVAGDVYVGGTLAADWGLHLGDMHMAMGNLLQIAETQGAAWIEAQAEQ